MAIELIINCERGLAKNENLNQGAFIIDEPTPAVLRSLPADRIDTLGFPAKLASRIS